jgi:hypothetical protein
MVIDCNGKEEMDKREKDTRRKEDHTGEWEGNDE